MKIAERANVANHLAARAGERPHAMAVYYPAGRDRAGRVRYTHWTYQQLDRECELLARGLASAGIGRGVRTVLMVRPSLEFFSLTFALFRAGAVPVLVDPGLGLRNVARCLAEARPQAFVGVPAAQLARCVLGWGRDSIRVAVTVGPRLPGLGLSLAELRRRGAAGSPAPAGLAPTLSDTAPDETAAILFTSGSTGPPKGAVYTHGIFEAQIDVLRRTYGIEPGEVDLCTFPLFALFAPALGMTAVVPDMDAARPGSVDPRKIFAAIEDFGVTNLFGSPALLDRVGRYGETQGLRTASLRRVLSAGAPVSAGVIARVAGMLAPGAQVFTPYGATEALPVTSIGSNEILGETRAATDRGAGVCVGRPVGDVRVSIIKILDGPVHRWSDDLLVPSGAIGEIVVAGRVVTREYFARPEATRAAKIALDDRGDFVHRMGDLGYLDPQGRLWFCGRKSHRVETPEGPLFTVPCEAVFNTHREVSRTALVGVPTGRRWAPVLCVELEHAMPRVRRAALRRELLELGAAHAHTRSIGEILFHPAFPVDIRHNAKIFREKLAAWAARRLR